MRTEPIQEPKPDPLSLASPRLGPYETEYDVRRGYDEERASRPSLARRAVREPIWIGRRRDS